MLNSANISVENCRHQVAGRLSKFSEVDCSGSSGVCHEVFFCVNERSNGEGKGKEEEGKGRGGKVRSTFRLRKKNASSHFSRHEV